MCVDDSVFGNGMVNDEAVGPCKPNRVGEQIAVCRATGIWELLQDGCILKPIQELLEQSEVTFFVISSDWLQLFSSMTTFSTDKKAKKMFFFFLLPIFYHNLGTLLAVSRCQLQSSTCSGHFNKLGIHFYYTNSLTDTHQKAFTQRGVSLLTLAQELFRKYV